MVFPRQWHVQFLEQHAQYCSGWHCGLVFFHFINCGLVFFHFINLSHCRREAAQAKKEAESQGDVVKGLRRDLAGATARMSDMAGELSDKQKQKLEHYEEKIKQQDTELEEQRKQLLQLSAVVDEQQKEINSREDKLTEQEKVSDHYFITLFDLSL